MKTFVEPWRKLIREIEGAISHSLTEGLPLKSIELTHEEWDAFVIARTTLANGTRIEASKDLDTGKVCYQGVTVYRGAP